jgi:hypothetical protein
LPTSCDFNELYVVKIPHISTSALDSQISIFAPHAPNYFSSTRKRYRICPNGFSRRVLYLIGYDIRSSRSPIIPILPDLVVGNRRLADRLVGRSVQNRGSSSSRIVVSSIVCRNRWCPGMVSGCSTTGAARRRPTAQLCAQRSTARAVSFSDPLQTWLASRGELP